MERTEFFESPSPSSFHEFKILLSPVHGVDVTPGDGGFYDSAEYQNLEVGKDITELFQHIDGYKLRMKDLDTVLKTFIPDYIPAIDNPDLFLKIPRPDHISDDYGFKVLDELPSIVVDDFDVKGVESSKLVAPIRGLIVLIPSMPNDLESLKPLIDALLAFLHKTVRMIQKRGFNDSDFDLKEAVSEATNMLVDLFFDKLVFSQTLPALEVIEEFFDVLASFQSFKTKMKHIAERLTEVAVQMQINSPILVRLLVKAIKHSHPNVQKKFPALDCNDALVKEMYTPFFSLQFIGHVLQVSLLITQLHSEEVKGGSQTETRKQLITLLDTDFFSYLEKVSIETPNDLQLLSIVDVTTATFLIFLSTQVCLELVNDIDEARQNLKGKQNEMNQFFVGFEDENSLIQMSERLQLVAKYCPNLNELFTQEYFAKIKINANYNLMKLRNSSEIPSDFYLEILNFLSIEQVLAQKLSFPPKIHSELKSEWQECLLEPALVLALCSEQFEKHFKQILEHFIFGSEIGAPESYTLEALLNAWTNLKDNIHRAKLGIWWRDVIFNRVYDFLHKKMSDSVLEQHSGGSEHFDSSIHSLCNLLEKSKSAAYCLGLPVSFQGTAQEAFSVAYKRLPHEQVVLLMAKLASFLNFFLSESKSHFLGSHSTNFLTVVEKITELVQAFQSQRDFSYFYEFLLADRLIRERYTSIRLEKWVLELLDTAHVMGKAHRMLDDMIRSVQLNTDFKLYVRSKQYHLNGDNFEFKKTAGMVLSGTFHFSLISWDCWPGKAIPKLEFIPANAFSCFKNILQEFYLNYKEKPERSRVYIFPMAGSVTLTWLPAQLLSGKTTPVVEIVVSPLQAAILMLFCGDLLCSIDEITVKTGVNLEEIQDAIAPLISLSHPILKIVDPYPPGYPALLSTNCLIGSTHLTLNSSFVSNEAVVIQSIRKSSQQEALQLEQISGWRAKVIEAAVVRALKGKSICPIGQVVQEVHAAVEKWHTITECEVRKCVEHLRHEGFLNGHASSPDNSYQLGLSFVSDGTEYEDLHKTTVQELGSLKNTAGIVGKTLFKLMLFKFELPFSTKEIHLDQFVDGMVSLAFEQKLELRVLSDVLNACPPSSMKVFAPFQVLVGSLQTMLIKAVCQNGSALLTQAGKDDSSQLPKLPDNPSENCNARVVHTLKAILGSMLDFVGEAFTRILSFLEARPPTIKNVCQLLETLINIEDGPEGSDDDELLSVLLEIWSKKYLQSPDKNEVTSMHKLGKAVEWECSFCTFINLSQQLHCEMCETKNVRTLSHAPSNEHPALLTEQILHDDVLQSLCNIICPISPDNFSNATTLSQYITWFAKHTLLQLKNKIVGVTHAEKIFVEEKQFCSCQLVVVKKDGLLMTSDISPSSSQVATFAPGTLLNFKQDHCKVFENTLRYLAQNRTTAQIGWISSEWLNPETGSQTHPAFIDLSQLPIRIVPLDSSSMCTVILKDNPSEFAPSLPMQIPSQTKIYADQVLPREGKTLIWYHIICFNPPLSGWVEGHRLGCEPFFNPLQFDFPCQFQVRQQALPTYFSKDAVGKVARSLDLHEIITIDRKEHDSSTNTLSLHIANEDIWVIKRIEEEQDVSLKAVPIQPVQTSFPNSPKFKNYCDFAGYNADAITCFFKQLYHNLDSDSDGVLTEMDFDLLPPAFSLKYPRKLSQSRTMSTSNVFGDTNVVSKEQSTPKQTSSPLEQKHQLCDGALPSLPLQTSLSTRSIIRASSYFGKDSNVQSFASMDVVLRLYEQKRAEDCKKTSEVLKLSISETTILLSAHNWNEQLLIESYLKRPEVVRHAAGLPPSGELPPVHFVNGTVSCAICYEEKDRKDGHALWCGHWMCKECWYFFLKNKVEERLAVPLLCPQQNCCAAVTSNDVEQMEIGDDLVILYEKESLRHYMEHTQKDKPKISWCKNPKGCAGLLSFGNNMPVSVVRCGLCGYNFCHSCNFLPHEPISCEMMQSWSASNGFVEGTEEELESHRLKSLTTKPCPKCGIPIEKNGGCSHMTCVKGNGGCGYEFCWHCLNEYHTTGECKRPVLQGTEGSALRFAETDKLVGNYFLGIRVAEKKISCCKERLQESCQPEIGKLLAIRIDCLCSLTLSLRTLAFGSILRFFLPVTTEGFMACYNFLFASLENHTRLFQQNIEENWAEKDDFDPMKQKSIQILAKRTNAALVVELERFKEEAAALITTIQVKELFCPKKESDTKYDKVNSILPTLSPSNKPTDYEEEVISDEEESSEHIRCELCDKLVQVEQLRVHMQMQHHVFIEPNGRTFKFKVDFVGFGSLSPPFYIPCSKTKYDQSNQTSTCTAKPLNTNLSESQECNIPITDLSNKAKGSLENHYDDSVSISSEELDSA